MTLNMTSNASSIFGSGMNGIALKSPVSTSPSRRMWSYRMAESIAAGLGIASLMIFSTFGSVIFPLTPVDMSVLLCYGLGL